MHTLLPATSPNNHLQHYFTGIIISKVAVKQLLTIPTQLKLNSEKHLYSKIAILTETAILSHSKVKITDVKYSYRNVQISRNCVIWFTVSFKYTLTRRSVHAEIAWHASRWMPSAKLYIFPYVPHGLTTIWVGFCVQVAKALIEKSCHVQISTFCSTVWSQSTNVTDRQAS